jgi:probable O-glycosylation ligase (exosortase A-associated)
MLRNIFVLALVACGTWYAFQGAYYALLFYLWNAYFRPESWVWGSLIGQLNLSFYIGVYLVAITLLSFQQFVFNGRVALLLLFAAQTLISTLLSEYPDVSWMYWTEFAKALLITYLIVVLLTDIKKYRLALVVIGLSLGFEAAKQGWVVFFLTPGAANRNSHPFLGDNNGVALGMMMLVPVLASLTQTATKRWEKYLFGFFAVGAFLRGFSTYSRGGFLAGSVVAIFYLVRSPRRIAAIVTLAVIGTILIPAMPQEFWDRMKTINASDEERDGSAAGRLWFWHVGQVMMNAKPLTGVGFNVYRDAYDTYDPSQGKLGFGTYRQTHSAWFGIGAEMGYPGLILLIVCIVQGIVTAFKIRRMTKGRPQYAELRAYGNAMETSLVVYVVGATFLSMQYLEMLWHFVGLSIALHGILVKATAAESLTQPIVEPVGAGARARAQTA